MQESADGPHGAAVLVGISMEGICVFYVMMLREGILKDLHMLGCWWRTAADGDGRVR